MTLKKRNNLMKGLMISTLFKLSMWFKEIGVKLFSNFTAYTEQFKKRFIFNPLKE